VSAPLLEMRGIGKSYGPVRALDDVALQLHRGDVLGIVGENGAGKSTLMKILGGAERPDAGAILLDGEPLRFGQTRAALDAGIVVIYQELSLVPERSIAENLYLGHLPRNVAGIVDTKRLNADAAAVLARVGLHVNPQRPVRRLRLAEQQLVEIARALTRKARVVVMDEPTSSLGEHDVAVIFAAVRALGAAGVGTIFISHHLEEVFAICNRVMVLRDGQTVETRPTASWTIDALVAAMVNRPMSEVFPVREKPLGDVRFEARGLASGERFRDVSFAVRAGEIFGLAGLIGAGRTEVAKTIFGALPRSAGELYIDGSPMTIRNPRAALRAGVVLVPEDRKLEGLVLDFPIRQNVVLSVIARTARLGMFLDRRAHVAIADDAVASLRIRTSGIMQIVRRLSGGNQQKVVLGRALTLRPRVLILDEPTRGIDVGAKVEVYRIIRRLASEGAAIIIVSSELLELIGLCDRVAVMRTGQITGVVDRPDFTQERLMSLAMTG
jgi:ABC-type sugar transport system ATPase subunit